MEDNGNGVPEDLRCKRSDGKQWRCNALSMPDKTVCEKHYYQAKKRAANSALRASLKKARTKYRYDSPDPNLVARGDDVDAGGGGSWEVGKKCKDKATRGQGGYSRGLLRPSEEAQRDALQGEDSRVKSAYNTPSSGKDARSASGIGTEEYYERSSGSSEAEGLTCHQCRRNDRANVAWCSGCDQKGYCDSCITRWYPEIPIEDIQKMCPACRGICYCRVCFNADILIKAKVQEIAPMNKLQYLHRLLSFVLPVLKQIFDEQCFEIGVETRVRGIEADIPRAKVNADEQMCCDLCKIPIFDYHRHCTNCLYDLCLNCCHELRQASLVTIKGDPEDSRVSERSRDVSAAAMLQLESSNERRFHSLDQHAIDFSNLFPKWRANSDGSIPCGPEEAGGCGSSQLVLRRILKINWAAKLVKNAKEIVSGCKISNTDNASHCDSRIRSTTSQTIASVGLGPCPCSQRDSSGDNLLYCPTSEDMKSEGVGHFQKHWVKGEPIIVKHVLEDLPASTWDPMRIWRGIQGIADERMKDDNAILKAIDCLNQSEVDIDLDRFITGYSEGSVRESGWPQMLKLRDSPPSSALEELISCHRPEFLSKLPLVEFFHFKWGVLNLAAKLPNDSLQTEVGPNIVIAYGKHEELARGDSVANLRINMGDLVHILIHSADTDSQSWQRSRTQRRDDTNAPDERRSLGNAHVGNPTLNLNERLSLVCQASHERTKQRECGTSLNNKEDEVMLGRLCSGPSIDSNAEKGINLLLSGREIVDAPNKDDPVAVWDIFRRQDVPMLNEFLRANWKEFTKSSGPPVNSVIHPVYHQSLFLNKEHKRRLKERFRIEPWTFEQHFGEAVFIPAGCPFQVRNLQSSTQLSFDFLSPESLEVSVRMAHEIRSLPTDHQAKLNILEVGKMSLYAASSAIREIQKITLDPKLSSDIRFEDRNLTEAVSDNVERFTKRRQIACT